MSSGFASCAILIFKESFNDKECTSMNKFLLFLALLPSVQSPGDQILVTQAWLVKHKAVLVDVRPEAAFAAWHLLGAVRLAVAPECVAAGVECVQRELGKAGLSGEEPAVVVGGDGGAGGGAVWLLGGGGRENGEGGGGGVGG